jgi:hypothetical protein
MRLWEGCRTHVHFEFCLAAASLLLCPILDAVSVAGRHETSICERFCTEVEFLRKMRTKVAG